MKTAKEYAEELVEKYDETLTYLESKNKAKKCALIAVDEIIKEYEDVTAFYRYGFNSDMLKARLDYLIEVKQEIEKLK